MATAQVARVQGQITQQRWRLLRQVTELLDRPMTVLAFVWLGLLILDFTSGLNRPLQILNYGIWGLFILHFSLEFLLAPEKWKYLRGNWLTALALVLPAFRVFRIVRAFRVFRAARAFRSVSLLRVITSVNRGTVALRRVLRRHGVGYIAAMTLVVILAGAAGMYAFENPFALRQAGYDDLARQGKGISNYGEAIWWTAMVITTLGPESWPKTIEGRILCLILAVYAFAFFGYLTATIASYFVGEDQKVEAERIRTSRPNESLARELLALREEMERLRKELSFQRDD